MRDVIVCGVMIAVVIILIRVIFGSPLVTRVRESFASGGSKPINSSTECPPGAQMYMYGGAPYCCSGNVDATATRVGDTCKPYSTRDDRFTFCTLGPAKETVKNCMELKSGLMQAEGETVCPANRTFVKGPVGSDTQNGRCCDDPGNPELTECVGTKFCDVSTDKNEFMTANSCQFQKAQENAGPCPKNYGAFTAAGQGAMASLTLFGCTDNGQNCYADSTIKRLKELGYDVSSLISCSKVGSP